MEGPTFGDRAGRQGSARWIKSSLSFSNGNCVEVASLPGGEIGARHRKHTEGPALEFRRRRGTHSSEEYETRNEIDEADANED